MGDVRVDPQRLMAQAQGLARAAVKGDDIAAPLRGGGGGETGDGESRAALDALARALDAAALGLTTVAGEVAATLDDVATAYAIVDGQGW